MKFDSLRLLLPLLLISLLPLGASDTSYRVTKMLDKGWIQGRVTHDQKSLDIPKLEVDRDVKYCGNESRAIQAVDIGPDQGLRNSVVYLKNIDSGKDFVISGVPPTLNQDHCNFQPHVQLVVPHSSIRITNEDQILHSIHAYQFGSGTKFVLYPNSITFPATSLFNIAMVASRKESFQQLGNPGIVKVVCDAGHYWMTAYLVVMANPYYAKVGQDGSFRIEDVPTGEYTLVSWHEYFGTKEQKIQVKANQPVTSDFVYSGEL
jgi:Polysaccharide lyase family 4, domain II